MGPYAPIFDEAVFDSLPVQGEIPKDLNGVYLRNGPNPRFAPQGRYHPFDGDAMVHALRFDHGRVEYRNRFVRTKGFLEEQAAGRALYAGLIDRPSLAERPGWGARGGLRFGLAVLLGQRGARALVVGAGSTGRQQHGDEGCEGGEAILAGRRLAPPPQAEDPARIGQGCGWARERGALRRHQVIIGGPDSLEGRSVRGGLVEFTI